MLSPLERSFSGRKRESLDTVDSFPSFFGTKNHFPHIFRSENKTHTWEFGLFSQDPRNEKRGRKLN